MKKRHEVVLALGVGGLLGILQPPLSICLLLIGAVVWFIVARSASTGDASSSGDPPDFGDVLDSLDLDPRDAALLRARIIESDYGRDGGWYVEDGGRRVAELLEPENEDMFWVSYRIVPLTDDPAERDNILSSPEYWLDRHLVYRSKIFGLVVEGAVPAGCPFVRPGRVNMRALYLLTKPLSPEEKFLLRS